MTFRIAIAVAWLLTTNSSNAAEGTITVHVDQPTVRLPETLYGLFYEDINYSADGGLYAELLQNRSFEYESLAAKQGRRRLEQGDFHPLTAWKSVQKGGGRCSIRVQDSQPLNQSNAHYATIEIEQPGAGVGLTNAGYDGIYVKKGKEYLFSIFARRDHDQDEPMEIRLRKPDGDVIGRATISGMSGQWKRYEATMVATETDETATLEVTTTGSGQVCVDMVSLFPRDTFRGRRNGLRKDLAQALADLQPSVFRFPGGCVAHGQGLDNAYRWKDTVGPIEARKPNWNLWGYHQSYGLGYFEYFQFCEDIGAAPLPILAVGVSCGFRDPKEFAALDDLQPWIDDALDLVEFANGSVDSRWGRVRAEMGHPGPFGLKYVGLGNEDHDTPGFRERFPHFVRALRESHPEIKIVGTSGLGPDVPLYDFMCQQKVDLSDEHYYQPPDWFISNQTRFDQWDRGKSPVFVGEYASRGNSLYNAVAEAAYLTGIERNADIVNMTAYAPLLARYGFTQWQAANLIWFDHKTVVRTPNYYVQQIFSRNKGDVYLKNEVSIQQDPRDASLFARGGIGLGTWRTRAIFDDLSIKVGQRLLAEEDFDSPSSWEVIDGEFIHRDGGFHQMDEAVSPAMAICPTAVDSGEATISLRAMKSGGQEGFLVLFGRKSEQSYYWLNLGGWGNTRHGLETGEGNLNKPRRIVAQSPGSIKDNVWYDIRIEITEDRIRCFLDDQQVLVFLPERPQVGVSASLDEASRDVIVKIANPLEQSVATDIQLRGAEPLGSSGQLTLLTGPKSAINSAEQPDAIKPVVRQIETGSRFHYELPPTSVQFIRIPSSRF